MRKSPRRTLTAAGDMRHSLFPPTDAAEAPPRCRARFIVGDGPYVRLRSRIAALRRQLKMTQEELAIRSGISRHTVLQVECGRHTPSTLIAFKIAAALDVPITSLFVTEVPAAPQKSWQQ